MSDERKVVDMRGAHDDGCYFCGRCECGDAEERRKALAAEVERLREKHEKLREAVERIDGWADAYPLEVFPEPDFKAVRAALEGAGISLDCVSASNMRHVITQVKSITGTALAKGGEGSRRVMGDVPCRMGASQKAIQGHDMTNRDDGMTTKIDLKRTLETCERATEGPWRVRGSTDEIGDDTNDILAWAKGNCNVCSDVDVDADADFIAHARTALPQYTEALEEAVGLLRDSPVEECPAPEPDKCGCYAAILGRFLSRFEEE